MQQMLRLRDVLIGTCIAEERFVAHNDQPLLSVLNAVAPSVRWGVEQALWKLQANKHNVPLHHLLSTHPRSAVAINGLLTGSTDVMLRAAQRMRDDGFRAVKLKVGRGSVQRDIVLTRQIISIIGTIIELRLDANRAWDWNTAQQFTQAVADLAIAYIEEPLADAAQLPRFIQQSPLPIALDETLSEVPFNALEQYNGVAGFVLKPALLGGVGTALRLARKAEAMHAVPVFSSLFETGLTITTLAQLAATLEQDVPTGLDTYRWLGDDVLQTPLDMRDGKLIIRSEAVAERRLQRVV
jgi:O-succinylbenzoate synthase